MSAFWHPFGQLHASSNSPVTIVRGEGVWIYDDEGNRYLDATASLWYANIGHGRPEIPAAVAAQMGKIAAYSTFGNFTNEPAEELASFLATRSPMADTRIFFVSGGADAVDTASKLARRYFTEIGQPEKTILISRDHGYHGTWGFGTSLQGIEANRVGYGELVPDTARVPYDDPEALEAAIVSFGPDKVAAVIAEPVIGAGGLYPPPPDYFTQLRAICDRHDVLLIVDSVICGFGRLGSWYGIERFDVVPDMITFAKGVTSGYLPLGGVAISGEIAKPFAEPTSPIFRHGPTYGGHPSCTAAGLANCHILEDEHILERGQLLEKALFEDLGGALASSIVKEVRGGVGLLAAVAFKDDFVANHPQALDEIAGIARANGVITRVAPGAIVLSPPLIIEPEEIQLATTTLTNAIRSFEGSL